MEITKEILSALSSSGNLVYQVLFNYKPLKVRGKNVQVKIVSDNDGTRPVFGIYESVGRRSELSYLDNYNVVIDELLANKVIGRYDFSEDFSGNAFRIQVNTYFRLVNIVQVHFQDLLEKIYINNVSGNLESSTRVLDETDKRNLFEYFEDLAVQSYVTLMDKRILRGLSKNFNIVFLNSLENFLPIFFTGPCLINRLLNCGKYSKVMKETLLYKTSMQHVINIDSNSVCLVTNKEICEGLSLDRFVPFTPTFLVFLLLGIFNPKKFPSSSSYRYLSNDGRIFDETTVLTSGIPISEMVRGSSLFFLIQQNARRLRITDTNLCLDILNNCTLI